MSGYDDQTIVRTFAEATGWELISERWPDEDEVVEDRVYSEPEQSELIEVWRHAAADRTLVIHYDYRYLLELTGPGGYQALQPVFWKTWDGDPSNVNGRDTGGYMSSHYLARARECYPNPSEGLALNRRWLIGSIIDQMSV